jgi:AmiR/NasT family two-component response regulator
MTRQSPLSVRGRNALVMVRDERELSTIRRQLDRLGVRALPWDASQSALADVEADIVFLDADLFPIESESVPPLSAGVPIVALIGTETPSRLTWLLELKPASFLVKPLRSAGLYSALVIAFHHAQQRGDAAERIQRLEGRVRSRRIVIAAVLSIMESHGMNEPNAFALIRRTAMQRRTTIEQLSAEIMATGGHALWTTRTA